MRDLFCALIINFSADVQTKKMMKKIKTKKDYRSALERFEEIFQAKSGTKESDEADVLSLLIKDYEEKYFLIKEY